MKTVTLDLNEVTVEQMEKILKLKEQISERESKIQWILSGRQTNGHKRVLKRAPGPGRPKNSKMSESSKEKIRIAQKARWAKVHAAKTQVGTPEPTAPAEGSATTAEPTATTNHLEVAVGQTEAALSPTANKKVKREKNEGKAEKVVTA